jgi:hypothetical protein
MKGMQPDPTNFYQKIDLEIPLIGFFDSPDPAPFEPLNKPDPGDCVFAFYVKWAEGKTLHITKKHYGCGGQGGGCAVWKAPKPEKGQRITRPID